MKALLIQESKVSVWCTGRMQDLFQTYNFCSDCLLLNNSKIYPAYYPSTEVFFDSLLMNCRTYQLFMRPFPTSVLSQYLVFSSPVDLRQESHNYFVCHIYDKKLPLTLFRACGHLFHFAPKKLLYCVLVVNWRECQRCKQNIILFQFFY